MLTILFMIDLLKAMRIERTIPIISVALIPFAIKNSNLKEYFIFILPIILIYSSIAIQNAIKDNDYFLPKNAKKISYLIIILGIGISLLNIYSFMYGVLCTLLGFIYNKFSRKIILGDSLIAGLTHFSLPFLFSGLIVGMEIKTLISLSIIFFFISPSIGPTTNLKDIEKDKKLKYKTLVNSVKNPEKIAKIFLNFSFILFIIIASLISKNSLLFFIPILILLITINKNMKTSKKALIGMRSYLLFSEFFIILNATQKIEIKFLSSIILLINLILTFVRINEFRINGSN